MRSLRVVLAAATGLVLLPFLVAENSAKIFVYLPWESPHRLRLTISFDKVPVAEVQPGKFFVINADPGSHVLIAGDGIPTVVEARASGESCVRVARQIEIGPSGKSDIPVLEVLSAEQARLDMINLVYVSPKRIFSAAVSKEDPFLHQRPKLKTRNSPE